MDYKVNYRITTIDDYLKREYLLTNANYSAFMHEVSTMPFAKPNFILEDYQRVALISKCEWDDVDIVFESEFHVPNRLHWGWSSLHRVESKQCPYHVISAALSEKQLQYYIFWKSKYKKGIMAAGTEYYYYSYLTEILLGLVCDSSQSTLNLLISEFTAHHNDIHFRKIDFEKYIVNYSLCFGLYSSNSTLIDKLFPPHDNYLQKKQVYEGDYKNKESILLDLGHYKASKSPFYQKCKDGMLLAAAITNVFEDLNVLFSENKIDFSEVIIGKPGIIQWSPFESDKNSLLHTHVLQRIANQKLENKFSYAGRDYKFQKEDFFDMMTYYRDGFIERGSKLTVYDGFYDGFPETCKVENITWVDRDFIDYIVISLENYCRMLAHEKRKLQVEYPKKNRTSLHMVFLRKLISNGQIDKLIQKNVDQTVANTKWVFEYEQKLADSNRLAAERQAKEERRAIAKEEATRVKENELNNMRHPKDISSMIAMSSMEQKRDYAPINVPFHDINTGITRFTTYYAEHINWLHTIMSSEIAEHCTYDHGFEKFILDCTPSDRNALKKIACDSNYYILWRNLIIKGQLIYPKGNATVLVLFYELINGGLFEDSHVTLQLMADLWNHYYPNFLTAEVIFWIRDYWVIFCHDVTIEQFKGLFKYYPLFDGDIVADSTTNIDMDYFEDGNILDFCNSNCDYRIKTGRMATDGLLGLLEACLKQSFHELKELFFTYGLEFKDYLKHVDVEAYTKERIAFRRAVVLPETQVRILEQFEPRITGEKEKCIMEYDLSKKRCILKMERERYSYNKSRYFIEYIEKVNELYIRDWVGIPASFRVDKKRLASLFPEKIFKDNADNDIIDLAIQIAVEQCCKVSGIPKSRNSMGGIDHLITGEQNRSDSMDVSNIDIVNYRSILSRRLEKSSVIQAREILLHNQERLIIDVEENTNLLEEKICSDQDRTLFNHLSPIQREFLFVVLHNNSDIATFESEHHVQAVALIEQINIAAIDLFGETIIDETNSELPTIFPEYVDSIANILYGENK